MSRTYCINASAVAWIEGSQINQTINCLNVYQQYVICKYLLYEVDKCNVHLYLIYIVISLCGRTLFISLLCTGVAKGGGGHKGAMTPCWSDSKKEKGQKVGCWSMPLHMTYP